MEQRKGIQLNQAFGAVLTLVLVATLVIVAIVIFVQLSAVSTNQNSVSTVNETLTPTDAGVAVAGASTCNFGDFSVTEIVNSSGVEVIDSGNYTASATGIIVNLTDEFSTAAWNVSYTYTYGSETCNVSVDMTTEFGGYTSLIGLVGTIIFLGLVIGILVAAFAFGGRREV